MCDFAIYIILAYSPLFCRLFISIFFRFLSTTFTFRLSYLSPSSAFIIPLSEPASSRGPKFCDPSPSPVSHYVREYAPYLDASLCPDMRSSDCVLTICDRHNVLLDTDLGAWVNPWFPCSVCVMWRRFRSLWSFIRCYEGVEREEDLGTLVWRYSRQQFPELGWWLI